MKNALASKYIRNKSIGNAGEDSVIHFLEKKGLKLIGKNFSARSGEIDAIFQRDSLLIFVEVKTRSGKRFLKDNIVSQSKQKRIISTTKKFLSQNQISLSSYSIRFDVAIVSKNTNEIEHIENAFYG